MKNKKIIILGASLVMSLTISAAVTDRVNGREDGRPSTLWVQMAEKAMETLGRQEAVPVKDPSTLSGKLTDMTEKPAEAQEPLTAGKASDTPEAVSDPGSAEVEKELSDTAVPSISETPVKTGPESPEALLPEADAPKTSEASVPKTAEKSESGAPAPQAVVNPEASEPAVTPAPAIKPQEITQETTSQPESEEDAEKYLQAALKTGPAIVAKDTILQMTNAAENSTITIQNNSDPMFHQAQVAKMDELYWNPAVEFQDSIGAKNALTQAFLYDMTVNHGQDGARNLISKAEYALGGTPGTGVEENIYLMKLMDLRETYLNNTGNPGADRVAAFRRILDTGNTSLTTPFSFTVYGDTFRIDGNIE